MSDDWDFYFTRVDDAPASIFLDLGVIEEAPKATHPRLVQVRVPLLAPRADGMPTEEEARTLAEVEDAIVSTLGDALEAIYVGRITGDARRELALYAPREGSLDLALRETLAAFPRYEFDVVEDDDPDWRHYRELLYPREGEWQWISDRRLIEQLVQHGDVLVHPRPVDHSLAFETEAGRDAFARAAEELGCRVTARGSGGGDLRFAIELERTSAVDLESIHPIVLDLTELAAKHGGTYDGWGCDIWKAEDVAALEKARRAAVKKTPAAKKKPSRAKAPPEAKKKTAKKKPAKKKPAKKKPAKKKSAKKKPAARKKR